MDNIPIFPKTHKKAAIEHQLGALRHILHLLGCADSHRLFITMLVSHKGDRQSFSVSDTTLAHSETKDGSDIKQARKRVIYKRKSLKTWQNQTGIVLVRHTPGSRKGQVFTKSQYELPVWNWAALVVEAANQTSVWIGNPNKALEDAAMNLLKEKCDGHNVVNMEQRRKSKDVKSQLESLSLTIARLLIDNPTIEYQPDIITSALESRQASPIVHS